MPADPADRADPVPPPDAAAADTLRPDGEPTPPRPTPTEQQKLPQSERYDVQELIGTGGMGRVYRAFDRKLRRPVALKFLKGADAALERRFLQEAQAQARIDHPNVCKVYEVGRIDDDPYIAMQFIDGKTLREAVRGLTVPQKVAVVRDAALAVQAAHQLGLVHRDLKPANILVEKAADGAVRPFITDFGLARDLQAPGDTVQGQLLGTPQYMAPEQARGEHTRIDARTDVYGLGATIYEALCGAPPFEGAGNLQTLYKMMNEEPPPLRKRAPEVPADVESVVLKALEKDPARRYQTARELAEDLQRTLDGEPVKARPTGPFRRLGRTLRRHKALSAALVALVALLVPTVFRFFDLGAPLTVAVADFDNQTGDEGLDGLSGMLITSLEQSRKLSVLTRSRMFDLLRQLGRGDVRRIDEPLGRELARKANAHALVLATIRRFDQLYAIDLKLLDPMTSEYIAALKEEGQGKASVPGLIDKLSEKARRALKDRSANSAQPAPVSQVTTANLEAYQRYFKGEELLDRLQFARAVEEYRAALKSDPEFALAWYRLAYSLMWMHDGERGREAISRALALDSKLPEKERLMARAVRGSLTSKGEEAYSAYKDCAARWPGEKECAFMLGDVIFHAGYASYAVPQFRRALELDPVMERAHQHLIWSEQLLGDKDALLAAARDYVARVGNDESWGHLGRAQAALGQLDEAAKTLQHAQELFPLNALPRVDRAALAAFRFDVDGAQAALQPALEATRAPRDRLLAHLVQGGALTQGGRIREALHAYELAASDAREVADPEAEAVALSGQGLLRFLFLGDAPGARKIAHDAAARGLPDAMFGFLYPLLGDIDRYGAVLRGAGDPLADKSVEAFTARSRGEFGKAAEGIEALSEKSPYRDYLYYVLADSWQQAHEDVKALASLQRAQATFPGATQPGPGFAGVFRARSDYQLGVIYERLGKRKESIEATKRFLAAWSKADPDLPEPADARARLARLEGPADIRLR